MDRYATGPLTLAELQINIPENVDDHLSDQERSCFLETVERRAREAGDPAALDPETYTYWNARISRETWSTFDNHMRRVLLAQAVLSQAMSDCL